MPLVGPKYCVVRSLSHASCKVQACHYVSWRRRLLLKYLLNLPPDLLTYFSCCSMSSCVRASLLSASNLIMGIINFEYYFPIWILYSPYQWYVEGDVSFIAPSVGGFVIVSPSLLFIQSCSLILAFLKFAPCGVAKQTNAFTDPFGSFLQTSYQKSSLRFCAISVDVYQLRSIHLFRAAA